MAILSFVSHFFFLRYRCLLNHLTNILMSSSSIVFTDKQMLSEMYRNILNVSHCNYSILRLMTRLFFRWKFIWNLFLSEQNRVNILTDCVLKLQEQQNFIPPPLPPVNPWLSFQSSPSFSSNQTEQPSRDGKFSIFPALK